MGGVPRRPSRRSHSSRRREPGSARPAQASDRALIRNLSQITALTLRHSQQRRLPKSSDATRRRKAGRVRGHQRGQAVPLHLHRRWRSVTEYEHNVRPTRTQTASQNRNPRLAPKTHRPNAKTRLPSRRLMVARGEEGCQRAAPRALPARNQSCRANVPLLELGCLGRVYRAREGGGNSILRRPPSALLRGPANPHRRAQQPGRQSNFC